MASIHVRFGPIMGGSAPVYTRKPKKSETITSSATHAVSTNQAETDDFVTITALTGAVYVMIGSSPVALATGAGMEAVASGGVKDFGPLKAGDKVSVIDAA